MQNFFSFLLFIHLHFSFAGDYKFIENKGQWNSKILFRADVNSGTLFLEKNCFTYSFYDNSALAQMHSGKILPESEWKILCHAFKINFLNSSPEVKVSGTEPSSEYYNYFIGNDRTKWVSHAKSFTKISYKNLYNGIDLNLYTEKGLMKYDFIISPNENPDKIKMDYDGAEKILIRKGELIVKTSVNEIIEQKPFAYQIINGEKKEVKCEFVLDGNVVSFSLGKYDKNFSLIIDPVLIFASYSGSTADNFGMTATYDNAGNFFAGGTAFNNGYPTTVGAYDLTFNNTITGSTITDVVITKYNSTGNNLIYSTYLGGNGSETVHSLIVNENDELFLYGVTSSTDFPLSANAYDNSFGGGSNIVFPQNGTGFSVGTDIYVTKFNAAGSALLGSTYIGGSANDGVNYNNTTSLYDSLQYNYGDQFRGEIMLDGLGNCYAASCTKSSDFPVVNGFQNSLNGNQDAVVFKFNSDLSALLWSTYLGGSSKDAAYSVKVDSLYNVYVAGGTSSNNFPATAGSLLPSYVGGKADGFIAKIKNDGTALLNASFIGTTSYDQCYFVELDEDTNVYLVGQTLGSFPVTSGVYNNPGSPQFIIKLKNSLDSVFYSTVFGNGSTANVNISPAAFLVDDCQNVYVSGWGANILQGTPLSGMPVTSDALFPTPPNGFDFYLFVLARNATGLIYATYFGGPVSQEHVDGGTSRFDKRGVVYQSVCAGCGSNDDFPTSAGSWSQTNNSFNCNNGTFKFDFQILPVASLTTSTSQCDSCTGTATVVASGGISPYTFVWDSLTGNSTATTVTNLCTGDYSVTVTDSVGCQSFSMVSIGDTSSLTISISSFLNPTCFDSCNGQTTVLANGGTIPYSYAWSDSSFSPSVFGLCAGIYYVTVTDSNNCQRATSTTLTSPTQTIFSNSATTNALCADSCSGSATVSVSGGTSPYLYQWNNSQTTPTASFLCAGISSVTVTDNNNCPIDTSFTISEPSPLLSSINTTIETCYGLCNGTAAVSVSGGTPSYSYSWSSGSISPTANNLCAGNYFVTITDTNNCQKIDAITVASTNFQSAISSADNSDCQNCNGTATAIPNGGFFPYSYLWNNFSVSQTITGLCAGDYFVTVTDSSGCDTVLSVTVSDPSGLILSLVDSTNLLCNGICTGQATTNASGNASPFSYLWSNGQTTPSIAALCAGTYSLTVTDTNNCQRFLSVNIAEPFPLIFDTAFAFNVKCYGGNDGTAEVSVSGGNSPYTYFWSNGETTSQISNLASQIYSVTITDSNNCTKDTALTISEPPPVTTNFTSQNQSCFNVCDGEAEIFASGGIPQYSYLWSSGSDSSSENSLCPGIYFVTVTDANNCQKTDTIVIDSSAFNPQTLELSADTTVIYEGENTTLHAVFDTSANFSWSPVSTLNDANSANPVASPLVTTTYTFSVSNPNNSSCSYSDTLTIFVVERVCGEPDIFVPNAFTPNNDNSNDKVFVRGNNISKMHFIIYDRWGEKIFETENQSIGWDGTYKNMKCDPGVFVYYLTATCIDEQEYFKKGNITLLR